jgi:peptide deformylase
MADLKIFVYGSAVLRKKAEPVAEVTPELREFAHQMLTAMYAENGVGLAAPQVGRGIRLVVLDVSGEDEEAHPLVLFNPEIVQKQGEAKAEEGCLSVPGVWADVTRPETVTVQALNENGEAFALENVSGLLARCIQHEIDHLDGVLFVDKISATDRTLNESKLKKLSREAKSAKVL